VRAVLIKDGPGICFVRDYGVLTGDERVVQDYVAVGRAANRSGGAIEGDRVRSIGIEVSETRDWHREILLGLHYQR